MQHNISRAMVQLFLVVQIFVFAGVASAQMKVACVGDSITALPSGWCGYLGTKLGSGYTAQTFGVSGTTLLKNVGQPAYSSSNQYKPSHDFAPNIVVIMLGTNDSMPRNWSAGKDHFVKDYEELIDSYASLATKPIVILNTAPPASDNNMFTISGMNIEKEVNPLIKQVAMNKMCPLADVWAALGGDVSKLGSADGVHPGANGSMLIADCVYKTIMSPVVPGGSAGGGGAGGASANTGGTGGGGKAGGSAQTAGASGSANTSGAGGASPGSASGGPTGGSANTGASGNTGSSVNTSGSTSLAGLAGAGGSANAGGTSSRANGIGVAGMSAPVVSAPRSSGGGCQMVGTSTSNSGPTAVFLLLLGIVIRSRKRRSDRERSPAATGGAICSRGTLGARLACQPSVSSAAQGLRNTNSRRT
jgi:acyl-CoA thioesterase-1